MLSLASAADAFDLRRCASASVDVTVPPTGRARRPGIRLHWKVAPALDEVTRLDGLPITTPARTLLDLAAAGLRARDLQRALDRAERLRLLDFAPLHALLQRHPRRPGTPALQAQLARYHEPADTRSPLETLPHELCHAHGLPRPQANVVVAGRVRDLHWPAHRLVVEADSYAWHRSPAALNDDRERDVELTLAGYRVLRFTYEQVTRRPDHVIASIRGALARRPAREAEPRPP